MGTVTRILTLNTNKTGIRMLNMCRIMSELGSEPPRVHCCFDANNTQEVDAAHSAHDMISFVEVGISRRQVHYLQMQVLFISPDMTPS